MPNSVENTNTGTPEQAAEATAAQPSVQVIDDVCVIVSGDAAGTLLAPVVVEKPADGQTYSLLVEPGKKYFFNFEQTDVTSFVQKDGDVTVTFKDGSTIVLKNYADATTSDAPAVFSFSDEVSADMIKVVDTTPDQENLLESNTEKKADSTADDAAQKVANVEPAAGDEAAKLAQIEPAAGEDGGDAGRGGYGYQSSFDPQGVIPLDDVGPIGPTALQYGVNFRNDILFVEEQDPNDVPNINDEPDIGSGIENVDETNALPETVSGTVGIDFGDDGAGSFGADGNFSSGYVLTSHSVPVVVSQTATGYVGMAGGVSVFEITINGNGDYSFTQFAPIDHANAGDHNDSVALNFGIKIFDVDGDSDTGNIVINIFDDGPAIVGDGTKTIDEAALGPVTVGGNLVENFGEDGPGDIHTTGDFLATGDIAGPDLRSGGDLVTVTSTATGYTGTANGVTVFDLVIDPATGGYEFTLRQPLDHSVGGDTITLIFGAEVVDYDGDTAATSIVIDVKDDGPEIRDDNPQIGSGLENVDETNALPETVNGTLPVDYGSDTPGTLDPNGAFTSSYALVSNGDAVTVTQTATGYVGTANGATIFEITIQNNGDYSFTQYAPLDHANTANPNDVITLNFGVKITDYDGDTDSGSITINIFDDGPAISGDGTKVINEDDIGPVSVNGNLVEDFGEDGQGNIHPNGTTSATGDLNGGVLSSNGVAVIITQTATGYVGTAGGATVFEVTINSTTGAYTFTLNAPLDHSAGGSAITLNFGAEIIDYDGDTANTDIVIKVQDDVPEISDNPAIGSGIENVDETNVLPETVGGTVVIDFGNDGPGTFGANGNFTSSYALTSHGHVVTVAQTATGYVGTANGATVFEITIGADGSYSYTQSGVLDHANAADPNDVIALNFGIAISDADGDSDTGSIRINVYDDGPKAADDGAAVTDLNPINGNVLANDSYGEDGPGELISVLFNGITTPVASGASVVINGTYGTLQIASNGDYTYTPYGGIDGTDQFGYTMDDYDNDTSFACLTINVDVDYKPVVLNDQVTVDETNLAPTTAISDTITADFGTDGPGTFSGNGGFTGGPFTSEGHAVNVSFDAGTNTYTGTANGGPVFTLALQSDGDYTFTLIGTLDHPVDGPTPADHDDSMSMQFGVTATDADGDTANGTITVNVRDDGPTAHNDVNTFTTQATAKDYNIVMVLDVSGSMAGNKLALLKSSVANLLGDFHDYTGGEIKVHIVPFATSAQGAQTFTITSDADFDAAVDFLNALNADGFTNYEAPMQSAITWLQNGTANDPIPGADTFTYFVSDGEPNRYINGSNNVATGDAARVMQEITGTIASDTVSEVDLLQSLSTQVIAVGIGVNGTTLGRLDVIDSNGDALDVQDPSDLDAVLQGTNPITGSADGNVITGLNGGPGAIDLLSQDDDTTVTQIAFNGTIVNVHPVNGASINGDDGVLKIFADGSYTYTLSNGAIATNGVYHDQFVYTITDGDGDTSKATLTLNSEVPDITVEIKVNNGADSICVKEDGQGNVPVTAKYTGGDGDEVMTLTMTGVKPDWVVTAPGWVNNGGGTYTLTLPAGQSTYNGNITFKPPANSDVDMTGLNITASVHDADSGITETASDSFNVQVDAVVDTPTLNASNVSGTQYWYYVNTAYSVPLKLASNVNDTDGSEQITKIVIDLNNPLSNAVKPYFTLEDMGIGLNKGTEVSNGIWEIPVNAGDAAAALNGLSLLVPPNFNYGVIHQNTKGSHTVNITVKSYVKEVNLSGEECDLTDNETVVVKNLSLTFAITPLVVDLDRDGVEIVDINANVMFDMNNNGTLDKTSRVGADDGLLTIDLNNDGTINNQSELFGDTAVHTDGFANLASYDSNVDGVIDVADDVFTKLQIWQDANQDGVSQTAELYSLTDVGIVGISLDTAAAGYQVADAIVTHEGTFQWADGTQGTISDVGFNVREGSMLNVGAELEGTSGRDIVYGTENDDILIGLAGSDILFGGEGNDVFLFQSLGDGVDTVKDFEIGDVLDVSGLLAGYDALTDAINDFVFKTESNGNTTILVDANGSGDVANATAIATLEGVIGLNLDQVTNHGQSAIV